MHPRFTTSCILMSAAVLALPSCRIINGKPDFHWIGDQFTPAMDDSVIVDRGVGALDIPASETITPAETSAPVPTPLPPAIALQEDSGSPVEQKQPKPQPMEKAPAQPIVYNVVAGDTLSGIAARYKTKTKTLIEHNRLDINKPLQLNQKLLIPVNGATLPSPAPTARPQSPQDARKRPGFFARLFGQSSQQPKQKVSHTTYSVVAGDTLTTIAKRHGTSTRTLIKLNQLDINKPLQINQKLLIPTPGAATTPTAPRRTMVPKKQEETSTPAHHEPVSVILPPQETTLPEQQQQQQQATTPSPAAASGSVYTIQPGDTLYGIARKLNISPEFLMNANGMTPETADKLKAGAILNLPTQKQP